jgi:hypothetical protein
LTAETGRLQLKRTLAQRSNGSITDSGWLAPSLFLLLTSGCLLSAVRAGVLAPEWSRPLDAAVVSTAVGANTYNTEHLFLLLADGRVLAVSAGDTLCEVGRAPEGATALVSLPTPPRGASDIALLLAVRTSGACDLVAWNRNGQQLWKSAIPEMSEVDSFFFVGEGENRIELCAWQRGEPWLIVVGKELWQYSVSAVRLKPGFTPRDAFVDHFDRDSAPELVFFDGAQLAVYHVGQGRELHCHWPEPDSAREPRGAYRTPGPRIACAIFDSVPVLLVVTGDTLRYVNAMTGDEERRFVPDSTMDLPGPATAVVASGPTAYATGKDRQGRCYVAKLPPKGPARERLLLPLAVGAQITSLALLKDRPMLLVSAGVQAENLLVCPPGLAGTADNAPGYRGVRFLRVIQLRVDEDTFPDLVVVRTAADARWRLDVFSNQIGRLAEELRQARRELLRAALGQNDDAVRRAVRRVLELQRETGTVEVGQEGSVLDRFRAAVRRRNALIYGGTLVIVLLSAGLGVLALALLRRRTASSQQIEKQPVADHVALAADLIALDHNFMSKGNRPAAFERLIEIRNRYGLERDRGLGQSVRVNSDQLIRVYAGAITRLIDSTPTLPLLSLMLTTAKSAPRGQEFEFIELSPEELRRLERRPGIRLIAITNHEYPDYHNKFRVFANPEVRGTLEHIILDHIRHAAQWAHIIISYTVSTQWNRRLLISFRSDSPRVIPYADPSAHITSQLRELAALLLPAIEVPRAASALVGPHEKLWLSIADYIAVLEEARSRLSVP